MTERSVAFSLEKQSVLARHKTNLSPSLFFLQNWCGPCRQIKPIYEEMSGKYEDISFGKVRSDTVKIDSVN